MFPTLALPLRSLPNSYQLITLTPKVKNIEHGRNHPNSNEIHSKLTPQILDLAIQEEEMFIYERT